VAHGLDGTGSITNCTNYGNVTSDNSTAFGIISTNCVKKTDKCCNYGNITAKTRAAGISRTPII
jgi:hypothetical protein